MCHYSECHFLYVVILSVVMLNVVLLIVVRLSVVAPSTAVLPCTIRCIYFVVVSKVASVTSLHSIHLPKHFIGNVTAYLGRVTLVSNIGNSKV